jgi:hypothetical protein
MITDLLASPYLRFGGRDLSAVQSVVSRISMLVGDQGSPAIVAAFVNDETLEAAAGASDGEERDTILLAAYRQAEDTVGEHVRALTERFDAIETELIDERDQSRGQAEAVQDERESLSQQISQLTEQVQERESALEHERVVSGEEIDRLKRERDQQLLESRRRSERWRRVGALGAAVAILAASIGLVAFGVAPPVMILGGAAVATWIAAPVVRNSQVYWRVGCVLTVLAVVIGVVQLLT